MGDPVNYQYLARPTLQRRREVAPETLNPDYDWKARRNDPDLLALREEMYQAMSARERAAARNNRSAAARIPQSIFSELFAPRGMGGSGVTTPTFNGNPLDIGRRPSVYGSTGPTSSGSILGNLKGGMSNMGINLGASYVSDFLTRGISNPLVRGATKMGATAALGWGATHALTSFAPGLAASLGFGSASAGLGAGVSISSLLGTGAISSVGAVSTPFTGLGMVNGSFMVSGGASSGGLVGSITTLMSNPITIWAAAGIGCFIVGKKIFDHQKDLKARSNDSRGIEAKNRDWFDKNCVSKGFQANEQDSIKEALVKNPGRTPQEAMMNLQAGIAKIFMEFYGTRPDGSLASLSDPPEAKGQRGVVDTFDRKKNKKTGVSKSASSQEEYLKINLEKMEKEVLASIEAKFGRRLPS